MAVKMNLRIITKNHAADPEIEFLAKSISKSNCFATAMPTAWEITNLIYVISLLIKPPYSHDVALLSSRTVTQTG